MYDSPFRFHLLRSSVFMAKAPPHITEANLHHQKSWRSKGRGYYCSCCGISIDLQLTKGVLHCSGVIVAVLIFDFMCQVTKLAIALPVGKTPSQLQRLVFNFSLSPSSLFKVTFDLRNMCTITSPSVVTLHCIHLSPTNHI